MTKSLALAFAALALSAGAAFANPAGDAWLPHSPQAAQIIDTPNTHGSGNAQALPSFDYGTEVAVTGSISQGSTDQGSIARSGNVPLRDSTLALVNRTGSGH